MYPESIYVTVTEQDMHNDNDCPVATAVSRCCKVPRDSVYVGADLISILCTNGVQECIYEVPNIVAEFLHDYQDNADINTKSLVFMSKLVEVI